MSISRRNFLRASAAAGGGWSLGIGPRARKSIRADDLADPSGCRAPKPLRILILGGTTFLGPHQIRYALERGHSVSIFTRGRTKPTIHTELFADVEHLIGDRKDDLTALEGKTWDAVIDNSGRRVEWTHDSARLLEDSVRTYLYTSSTGVYLPYLGTDIGEDTELVLEDPRDVPASARPSYGVMKSLSEIEVRKAFGPDRSIVVRPTYIVGPGDPTARFPYWPVRLERGGDVVVPGKADDPIQYIDARDLTEWMIRLVENRTAGTFNVAGPASPMGMHAFVYGVHAATSSRVSWVPIDDYEFLRENRVRFVIPWIMPIEEYVGSARINIDRALAKGLTHRPLCTTATDVLRWWHSDAVPDERRRNLVEGQRSLMRREPEVLAAWRDRRR